MGVAPPEEGKEGMVAFAPAAFAAASFNTGSAKVSHPSQQINSNPPQGVLTKVGMFHGFFC